MAATLSAVRTCGAAGAKEQLAIGGDSLPTWWLIGDERWRLGSWSATSDGSRQRGNASPYLLAATDTTGRVYASLMSKRLRNRRKRNSVKRIWDRGSRQCHYGSKEEKEEEVPNSNISWYPWDATIRRTIIKCGVAKLKLRHGYRFLPLMHSQLKILTIPVKV